MSKGEWGKEVPPQKNSPRVVYADSADSIRPYERVGVRPCVAIRGDTVFWYFFDVPQKSTTILEFHFFHKYKI